MIGKRIKLARQTRKKSQSWLSQEVGVTQSSISEWETGNTDPTTDNLARVAKVLSVNFEWLAKGSGDMDGVVLFDSCNGSDVYSTEQRELILLFDQLPKNKRELLMRFLKDWIEK